MGLAKLITVTLMVLQPWVLRVELALAELKPNLANGYSFGIYGKNED